MRGLRGRGRERLVGRGSGSSAEIGCHARSRADDMLPENLREKADTSREKILPVPCAICVSLSAMAMLGMRNVFSDVP